MSVKICTGDTVEVIAGNDKGQQGEVLRIIRKRDEKGRYDPNRAYVVVAGANLVIKHQRATGRVSTQTGRITLRNDRKKLTGKSIFQDQTRPEHMTWDPESNLYRGKIRLAAAGGRVNMDFTLRVVNPRRMVGSLSAKVTVNQGGVSGRCTVNRGLALKRTGD